MDAQASGRSLRRGIPFPCAAIGRAMRTRQITPAGVASACYFRSSEIAPGRKALVQITERCNLHCAHCFVSATRDGRDMAPALIESQLLPRLQSARVRRLTLTGGEPFAHPQVIDIAAMARQAGMGLTICSNATLIEPEAMAALDDLGARVNVSLDGFSARGHGKFRGAPSSFEQTVETMRLLGERGLLKGVLVTPNRLAAVSEYEELCEFARRCGAEYVLMNPLSPLGRGNAGIRRLGASEEFMRAIAVETAGVERAGLELVRIRFPNDARPLSACEAGTILYVFAEGDVTVCPYLVFAARTPGSCHDPGEFVVGNIFDNEDLAERLDRYPLRERVKVRRDPTCEGCAIGEHCGGGCPAAVVAAGGRIGERDRDQCPIEDAV